MQMLASLLQEDLECLETCILTGPGLRVPHSIDLIHKDADTVRLTEYD